MKNRCTKDQLLAQEWGAAYAGAFGIAGILAAFTGRGILAEPSAIAGCLLLTACAGIDFARGIWGRTIIWVSLAAGGLAVGSAFASSGPVSR